MADIKTREHSRDIKVLDKSLVAGERMKNAFIRSKNQRRIWQRTETLHQPNMQNKG